MAHTFEVPAGYEVTAFRGLKTITIEDEADKVPLFVRLGLRKLQTKKEEVVYEHTALPTEGVADFTCYTVTVHSTFMVYGVYLYTASDRYDSYPGMYIQTLHNKGGFECQAAEVGFYIDTSLSEPELAVSLTFTCKGMQRPKVTERELVCRFPSKGVLASTLQTMEAADTVIIAKLAEK